MSQSSRLQSKNEKNTTVLSKQYSSRDLASHTKLKLRQSGQNTQNDLIKKDFKKDLIEREKSTFHEKLENNKHHSSNKSTQLCITNDSFNEVTLSNKRIKTENLLPIDIDADDPIEILDNLNTNNSNNSDSDSDSNEDDTDDLLAELNRIKNERALEESKKEAEQKAKNEKIRIENILHGNPLKNISEFKVKRRWDDDVVFKNCSRDDNHKEKHFINDTLRSEFHQKFMEKYIK